MKKLLAIFILLFSTSLPQENQPYPPIDLISIPTSGTLPKGTYSIETLLTNNGGVLPKFLIGITENFTLGFSYGFQNFIGTDEIEKNKSYPEFNLKYRVYEESERFPAILIGFDTQGKGDYDETNERYDQKAVGLYLVASRNWNALGNLGFHIGINKNFMEGKDKDLNLFFGIDKEINRSFSLLAEYNFARNDDEIQDTNGIDLREGNGIFNLGIRWSATDNLMLEFNFNDTFKNIKYLDKDDEEPIPFKSRIREIKVVYFEQF
tara:strand:- start:478 stop:1269 length:792 start_codon:yes stop_codon:yes gene_type:complete